VPTNSYGNLQDYYKKNPNPKTEARIANNRGYLYWHQSRVPRDALKLFQQGLISANKARSRETLAQILKNIGLVQSDQGTTSRPSSPPKDHCASSGKSGTNVTKSKTITTSPVSPFFFGDYEKAEDLFRQAYDMCRNRKWYETEAYILPQHGPDFQGPG